MAMQETAKNALAKLDEAMAYAKTAAAELRKSLPKGEGEDAEEAMELWAMDAQTKMDVLQSMISGSCRMLRHLRKELMEDGDCCPDIY